MATVGNPTELLWAYALKREHKYLLSRIASVELIAATQETRVAAAEKASASTRDTDIAGIAKQVKNLQHGAEKQSRDLEHKVAEALDAVQATSEATCLKVASLEKEGTAAKEEERVKTFQREKAVLQRLGELEIGLQAKGGEMVELKEKVEESGVGELKEAVEGLEVVVEQQGDEIKAWRHRLAEAERKLVEQGEAVEACKQEAARIATEAAVQAAAQAARGQMQTIDLRAAGPARDGSAVVAETLRVAPETLASGSTAQAHAAPKKSSASHKTKMTKELASLLAESGAGSSTMSRPVVRSGPGWLEVERTPSGEMPPPARREPPPAQSKEPAGQMAGNGSSAASNAKPAARSKKRTIDTQPTYTQRTTRSQVPKKLPPGPTPAIAPAAAAPAKATRRQPKVPAPKASALASKKQPTAAGKKAAQAPAKRPRPSTPEIPESPSQNSQVAASEASTILSSPLSSPSPAQPRQKKQRQAPVVQVEASPQSPPRPPQRRRRIDD